MMFWDTPEPRTEPPKERYIYGDCGHEIYEHEEAREIDGRLYCPDCARDELNEQGE